MNSQHTIFKKATINSFGGITPDASVVIVFPEDFKGVVKLVGDEATNKSSTLKALEALMGSVYPDYFVNKQTKSVDGSFEFIVNDVTYRTKLTTSTFKLEQYVSVTQDKGKWLATGENKALVRKLLPYATSPEHLTQKNGESQLKWLKEVAGKEIDGDAELEEKETKIYKNRTTVNSEVATLKRQLLETPGNFKSEAKDILPTLQFQQALEAVQGINLDQVIKIQQEELESAEKDARLVAKSQGEIELMDTQILDKQKDIEEKKTEMQRILDGIKYREVEIEAIKGRRVKAVEFIDNNKIASDKVKVASEKLEETKKTNLDKENLLALNKKYEEYKGVFDKANKLTNEIDEIRELRVALAKTITPDIPGFEVRPGGIDQGKGLFYNDINIAVLSESERYGLVIKILKHFGTKVLFIENISSFGSNAMKIIQMFADEGGFVFASMMNRNQEKMSVTFSLNE